VDGCRIDCSDPKISIARELNPTWSTVDGERLKPHARTLRRGIGYCFQLRLQVALMTFSFEPDRNSPTCSPAPCIRATIDWTFSRLCVMAVSRARVFVVGQFACRDQTTGCISAPPPRQLQLLHTARLPSTKSVRRRRWDRSKASSFSSCRFFRVSASRTLVQGESARVLPCIERNG